MGLEFGAEAQVTPTIKVKGALALGESIYTNNPNVYLGRMILLAVRRIRRCN